MKKFLYSEKLEKKNMNGGNDSKQSDLHKVRAQQKQPRSLLFNSATNLNA